VAGPLSSERPASDANLTGGDNTSVSREINQDFKQVKRTVHMDRPARTGTFSVSNGATGKKFDQKTQPGMSNLRVKASFKRRRLRK
jgi:hypothetical protein